MRARVCASADRSGGDKSIQRHPPRNTWTASHQNLPHPSHDSHGVPEGAAERRAGGEQPFTCTVIYIKVNLHLQQQQLEQTHPLTDADVCSASSVRQQIWAKIGC